MHSPHGPAAVVAPLLGTAADIHLVNVLPGDRAVEQADVATGCADGRGGGARCVWIGGIGPAHHSATVAMRGECLAITRRPIIHFGNQDKAGISGESLWRDPGARVAREGGPGSIRMTSMIVVANDIAIFLLFKRPIGLMLHEVIDYIRTARHSFAAILHDRIARDAAQHRQVVVVGSLVRCARRNGVVIVIGVHVHGEDELAHTALAARPAAALLGATQGRQKERRQNGDNCDDDQQLDKGERDLAPILWVSAEPYPSHAIALLWFRYNKEPLRA